MIQDSLKLLTISMVIFWGKNVQFVKGVADNVPIPPTYQSNWLVYAPMGARVPPGVGQAEVRAPDPQRVKNLKTGLKKWDTA